MEAVILITANDNPALFRERISPEFTVTSLAGGRLAIARGSRQAYLGQDSAILDDFDAPERRALEALGERLDCFALEFSDIGFCKDLLLQLADDPEVYIDNDHGILEPGPRFLERLREAPEWDWRS